MTTDRTDILKLKPRFAPETPAQTNSDIGERLDYAAAIKRQHDLIAPEYIPLVQTVFLSPEDHPAHGSVVAFTHADGSSGIGKIVKALANQLAGFTGKSILVADVILLQRLRNRSADDAPQIRRADNSSSVWVLTDKEDSGAERSEVDSLFDRLWQHNSNYGQNPLQQLRHDFDFILLECEKLEYIGIIAPLADGVVVVAASNRTKRAQISRAQQLIEITGGKLLGFVLDRHRSPLPSWISRWL